MGDSDDITLHYDSADTRFELSNATGLALRIDDGSAALVPGAQMHLEDDVLASFGNTAAAPDVWADDNGTYFCLTSTSVDGGGTDGDLFCYTLGGNALQVGVDALTFAAATDLDLLDNDSSALSFDAADKAGLLNIDTTDGAEGIGTSGWFSLGAGTVLSSAVDGHLTFTDSTGTQTFTLQTNADGRLHLSGALHADLGIVLADNRTITFGIGADAGIFHDVDQTPDTVTVAPGTESNTILIREYYSGGVDFAHPLKADPTITMHATGNTDKTTFNEIDWHRVALGGGGGGYGCLNQTFAYDDLVDGGGASGTLALDEGMPDGAVVQQTVLHSLTGFTGDTSAVITVGDGTDVDRYNTGTPSVFTTNASGVAMGAPSGTVWHDDAATVTVTITSNGDYSSVSAGQATILICYWTP
jgi:hypothetical protein